MHVIKSAQREKLAGLLRRRNLKLARLQDVHSTVSAEVAELRKIKDLSYKHVNRAIGAAESALRRTEHNMNELESEVTILTDVVGVKEDAS